MRIALTKKLADAMGVKIALAKTETEPLFSWTANWTNTFDGRKEDMVVMLNSATRFTVVIWGVKRNQFKGIAAKMTTAIRNTLLALNFNSEMVDEYMHRLGEGEVEFCSNNDRKITAQLNKHCFEASYVAGRVVNASCGEIKFCDTFGTRTSRGIVDYGKSDSEHYVPVEKMAQALSELTGKPSYNYHAFELLVTLDLEIYQATRRLIVPADIPLEQFHKVLQKVFDWKNCHLHDFTVFDKSGNPVTRIVCHSEDLGKMLGFNLFFGANDKRDDEVLESDCKLSDYFPEHKTMLYTYDMGDSWEHVIELIRVIDAHDAESPYLLEAVGQTPPEDVGGVGGFLDFREVMLNPNHPEYAEMKEWVGYWSPELREWEMKPKVID